MNGASLNPFLVMSPESLSAQEACDLYVDVFPEFSQVRDAGNTIITGARGVGKSMIFRCMLPDVLMHKNNSRFSEIDFVAFHIRIKNTQLRITDMLRALNEISSYFFNEHIFVLYILQSILDSLSKIKSICSLGTEMEKYKKFYDEYFKEGLELCGCEEVPEFDMAASNVFEKMLVYIKRLYQNAFQYVLNQSPILDRGSAAGNTVLRQWVSFSLFLRPFLVGLRTLPGFPDKDIYLLIDDADNLSLIQTKILNTWIAMRTQPTVSIKVSTQLYKYKTYSSIGDLPIESPHDYQEINVTERYARRWGEYRDGLRSIVERRLKLRGMETTVYDFFPQCAVQEEEINRRIHAGISEKVARVDYMRDLAKKKNPAAYRYAGFDQLARLSSGVVRYFLDGAAMMYDRMLQNLQDGADRISVGNVCFISHDIQNSTIRKISSTMMLLQFQKMETIGNAPAKEDSGTLAKLQNLIFSMGETFRRILVSDRQAERRVLSIGLKDIPDSEVKEVLRLGVQVGFLQMDAIGNKACAGKTWMYTLNRMLVPHFDLDPSTVAGCVFVTNEMLKNAFSRKIDFCPTNDDLDGMQQMMLFD